jgi:hypothetical protein
MKTRVIIGVVIVVILILAGGAWYAYSNPAIAAELGFRHPAPVAGYGSNTGSTTPNGRRGGAFAQGGFESGTIEVLNGTGFTITLSNGDTKNINLSATTTVQNYATASSTPTTITADQLSVGEQVSVIGTPESDGSIDARFVRTGAVPTRPIGGTGGSGPRGVSPGHYQPQTQ